MNGKYLVNSRILYKGGFKERGAYFKFLLTGEGLIRERGLTERGGLIELLRYIS